jgi:hypothetical protein
MQVSKPWTLEPDRLFDPNPARRSLARSLYTEVDDMGVPTVDGASVETDHRHV